MCFGPRLRSLRSLSLGLLVSVPLRGTTAGHEREELSVLREASPKSSPEGKDFVTPFPLGEGWGEASQRTWCLEEVH